MPVEYSPLLTLPARRELFYATPWAGVHEDYSSIYNGPLPLLGVRKSSDLIVDLGADTRYRGVIGAQLGDEGKGKVIKAMADIALAQKGIETLDGIRYNGGSNAGHTVEFNGKKIDLHQIPSVIFHERATAILDKGMAINVEDLRTEVGYIEDEIGSTKGRILVSPEAALVTDLERAEEKLNNELDPKSSGGTGRGISPAYAHRLDRTGSLISNLLDPDWREHFAARYQRYQKTFAGHGKSLSEMEVPDFKKIREKNGKDATVGTLNQFLDRLAEQRQWFLDQGMAADTFSRHKESASDPTRASLSEGAQAVGLHPWNGTYPDTTSSDTSFYGVNSGTGYIRKETIFQRLAIAKHNPSSVGARIMPTHIDLSRRYNGVPERQTTPATPEQLWAIEVRDIAQEVGTTTGRWRDMNHWDLAFLNYNLVQGGANELGITHMDVQREDVPVRVYFGYKNEEGQMVGYQPSLEHLKKVHTDEETYIELPGWDGKAVANAKTIEDMPENAQRMLGFIQARTGVPVVVFTNGYQHDAIVGLPGFSDVA